MRVVIAILLVSMPAFADETSQAVATRSDEILHGSVVKVEDKEIYVDLGNTRGVHDGAPLRIKRAVKLKHPITRAVVDDWIPIGSATVTEAAGSLSRAVVGELVDAIRPGDLAEVLLVGHHDPERPAPPLPNAPAADPDTVEVLRVFAGQSGAPLDTRIASWERYLSTRPNTRFASAIRTDLDTLHKLRDEMQPPSSAETSEAVTTVEHHAPADAAPGGSISLVFVLAQPDRVASAYLHYRTAGDRTYRRLLLVREHDIYLRGVVPPAVVRPPGVEYFVELTSPNGRSSVALGSPSQPTIVDVAPPPLTNQFEAATGRSSVRFDAEVLDFATLDKRAGNHADRMTVATLDFTYRMTGPVESLGVGYGIYDGYGGFANRTWSDADPLPESGFRFGYADIELGGDLEKVHVSGGGQVIAGVGRDGFGMGVEGRIRIGHRDGTNLLFLGRTVDQVGYLSEVKLGIRPLRHAMFGVLVGATDQPGQGDVGVKLGTEVELLGIDHVSVLARGSWQGRSVDHGGLGGGAGIAIFW
jgi:hypothetical protein